MTHRMFLIAWLVIVWMALWRDPSIANLVGGLLVAIGITWLFPVPTRRSTLRVRPLALLRFLGHAAVAIVRANLVVAWEVITPGNRTNEGVVAVDLREDHPVVITLVSHAIGLAPGTFVVDVEGEGDGDGSARIYVHVLHLREVEDVRHEVLELERLALAAVASQLHDEEAAR
ncbi:MAG: Na+/H+ antiporter subunit E [Actinomycetota bacterium]